GRDPERFAPRTKEKFVLTAGRLWDEAKNVAALERIAPYLAWPVYAAGALAEIGDSECELQYVQPLGRLSSGCLGRWMGRAAIYALPARYEPFGLSALEAGLSGCALVLGDISSLREVWQDAALFVPPDQTEILQKVLMTLMSDRACLQQWAARARARALEFT